MNNLKEGELVCPVCDGRGWIYDHPTYTTKFYHSGSQCKKCHGIGKLDWIELIVGKKRNRGYQNITYTKHPPKNPSVFQVYHNIDDLTNYIWDGNYWMEVDKMRI